MSVVNLDLLFKPKSIAVIGGSDRPQTVGNYLMQNLIGAGFEGPIYPVNPTHDRIYELPALKDVMQLPLPPDLALVAVPARSCSTVLRQLAAKGTRTAVVISAGFREVGEQGVSLERELEAVSQEYPGFRILGPNCLGFLMPGRKLNASFAAGMPKPGQVAFVSQSGALCSAMLDWAIAEDIGFSCFVSLGNQLDVDCADLIDYLANDEQTHSLVLYVESIVNARKFMSAARAFTRRKPIVVYKAGRFMESAQAAASHTGALAGLDAAYEAAFHRAAMVRVYESDQLFACAELLARSRLPPGNRLAIVTNAGGPGVMATDALVSAGGQLAPLAHSTIESLNNELPASWSHHNPIDVLGDATPERFARASAIVLKDESVDAMLAVLTPQAMTQPLETARQLSAVLSNQQKPVLATFMGGQSVQEARAHLNQLKVPTYDTPEQAVRAFLYLASYARSLEVLYQAPRAVQIPFGLHTKERQQRAADITDTAGLLSEPVSKRLLSVYDIPTVDTRLAVSLGQAEQVAEELGYPLVMKIVSRDVTHKSDTGGVAVNLETVDALRREYDEMFVNVRKHHPNAEIDGVSVQSYVHPPYGVELILGAQRDPAIGPVVMIGLGGVTAELFRDCSFELPPLDERLATRMLERLRCWPLLAGYRGRPRLAVDQLIATMLRFSTLITENPNVTECDINPLLITPDSVLALDARFAIDSGSVPPRPYSHLAIAPYPEELARHIRLKDGTLVTLRPIRPEDESLWHEMLDAASDKSLWQRFRSLFRERVHLQSHRYCFIDYDREMAFVAETVVANRPHMVGISRLVADCNHESAEFAILVIDAWQGRGLGRQILKATLDYARASGLKRVYAETSRDNRRVIELFKSEDFTITHATVDPTTAIASLRLTTSDDSG